jgi:hypothetical protein
MGNYGKRKERWNTDYIKPVEQPPVEEAIQGIEFDDTESCFPVEDSMIIMDEDLF